MQSVRPSPRYRNDNAGLPLPPRSRTVATPVRALTSGYYDDRSAGDARQSPLPNSLRQNRPQRSATHDGPVDHTYGRSDYERPSPEGRGYTSSESSRSSSSSSLLDGMRVRSNESTPRTSIEEEDYISQKAQMQSQDNYELPAQPPNSNQTSGSWLWSAVSGAAANLSVNVSKAWAADIEPVDGEATPPGQESRLTRAMKAYYLQKARDPSDLPDWLFSAQECHPGRTHPIEDVPGDDDGARKAAQPVHGREPRNMYDTAASEPRTRDMREGRGDPSEPSSSKAADRLKAMRDARRQGTGASGGRDGGYEAGHVRSRAELSGVARDDGRVARGPGGRIGLPVGPGRVRRV